MAAVAAALHIQGNIHGAVWIICMKKKKKREELQDHNWSPDKGLEPGELTKVADEARTLWRTGFPPRQEQTDL